MLTRATHAKRVLEIGTRNGLATVALALAVPTDGQVITIDETDKHLGPVRSIWKEAGIENKVCN